MADQSYPQTIHRVINRDDLLPVQQRL